MGRQAALLWSGLGAFWVVAVPLSWALAFPAHLVQQLQHCAAICRSGQLAQPSAPAPYSPLTVQLFCCRPFTTVMLQPCSSLASLPGLCTPVRCRLRPLVSLSCHASDSSCLNPHVWCRGSMGCGLARWQALLSEVRRAASAAGLWSMPFCACD